MASTCVTMVFAKVKISARASLPRGARINPTDPLMTARDGEQLDYRVESEKQRSEAG